jgi:hypothetical protein
MKHPILPATAVLVLLLTGCQRMKTTVEQDSAYRFDTISTYRWIDGPKEILDEADTYIHADIQAVLDEELRARGWRPEAELPDVHAAYYVKLREQTEYSDRGHPDEREFSGGFVYNRDTRGWSYAEREPELNVYTVEIGTLTVLLYDASGGGLIWKGSLQTKIDRSLPAEKRKERIRKAVEKLLGRLPASAV